MRGFGLPCNGHSPVAQGQSGLSRPEICGTRFDSWQVSVSPVRRMLRHVRFRDDPVESSSEISFPSLGTTSTSPIQGRRLVWSNSTTEQCARADRLPSGYFRLMRLCITDRRHACSVSRSSPGTSWRRFLRSLPHDSRCLLVWSSVRHDDDQVHGERRRGVGTHELYFPST